MLNDRSTPLSLLATRRSGKPRELVAPGPSDAELAEILTIAARTPDHGKLAPWRFVIVSPDQRESLARLLREAIVAEDSEATQAHLDKAEDFAMQAPSLVVLIAAPVVGHKIPVWEQSLSAGAVAMNMLHAANALGYVGGWVTGRHAYSPHVAGAFCAAGERIAGFIFFGTPMRALEERERPALDMICRPWSPPAA